MAGWVPLVLAASLSASAVDPTEPATNIASEPATKTTSVRAWWSGIELSAGLSMLAYWSPYAGSTSVAPEAAVHGPLSGAWKWGVGTRVGLAPVRPEGFLRLLAQSKVGIWEPAAGIELGLTSRASFDRGEQLLRELREASVADTSPWYAAFQAMPLQFCFWEGTRLGALDLQVGTQISPLGRVVRLQLGVVSFGMTL